MNAALTCLLLCNQDTKVGLLAEFQLGWRN